MCSPFEVRGLSRGQLGAAPSRVGSRFNLPRVQTSHHSPRRDPLARMAGCPFQRQTIP